MKNYLNSLLQNDLFLLLMNWVIIDVALYATLISILQVPPDAILDSGLKEILMIFEG